MYFDIGYDKEQLFYNLFVALGILIITIYNFSNINKKKEFPSLLSTSAINIKKETTWRLPVETVVAVVEICFIIILYYLSGGVMNVLFGNVFKMSANYFGMIYFSPLLLLAGCYIIGLDPVKVFDMIAPTYPLGLIFAKTACFFPGCCSGIEWEHGLYNFGDKAYQVPIQLIEAGWALLIFIIFILIRKKLKPGTGFPLYLILYSSFRFCSEFLRAEPNILGPLKLFHLLCLSGILFGTIGYIVALRFADKISLLFTENNTVADYVCNSFDKAVVAYQKNKQSKMKKPIVHHKKKKKKKK